jgi:hypothetical protein
VRAAIAVVAALVLLERPGPAFAQDVQPSPRAGLEAILDELRGDLREIALPEPGTVTRGARTIAAGESVTGPIAVWGGNLEIRGAVVGDVVAIDGDVIIAEGGRVDGDVLSVRGATRIRGVVTGSVMRLDGSLAPAAIASPASTSGPWRSLGVTLASLAIFLMLGIGVLIFAGPTLDGVAEALDGHLGRPFLIGVGGQLAVVPALLLLIVALAITVIGALLVPFAIVAYVLALSGAGTLAFLTVALVMGRAVVKRRGSMPLTRRAESLRAMIIGVSSLFALWIVAAALAWSPLASGIIRILALIVTWVAMTAGFGAVLISRAGTRRREAAPARPPIPDEVAWQTPTPVSGVAAARRPTPIATGRGQR